MNVLTYELDLLLLLYLSVIPGRRTLFIVLTLLKPVHSSYYREYTAFVSLR